MFRVESCNGSVAALAVGVHFGVSPQPRRHGRASSARAWLSERTTLGAIIECVRVNTTARANAIYTCISSFIHSFVCAKCLMLHPTMLNATNNLATSAAAASDDNKSPFDRTRARRLASRLRRVQLDNDDDDDISPTTMINPSSRGCCKNSIEVLRCNLQQQCNKLRIREFASKLQAAEICLRNIRRIFAHR